MRRCYPLMLLLLFTPLAGIAATGAWSASVSGPGLGARGSWLLSPALRAPSAAPGNIAVVNWRYQLSRPAQRCHIYLQLSKARRRVSCVIVRLRTFLSREFHWRLCLPDTPSRVSGSF